MQKVGLEDFGIACVDCTKARFRWMLCDFYGKVLLPPTSVEHNQFYLSELDCSGVLHQNETRIDAGAYAYSAISSSPCISPAACWLPCCRAAVTPSRRSATASWLRPSFNSDCPAIK